MKNLTYQSYSMDSNGQINGKLLPKSRDSRRLQELSLGNHTYFEAIQYHIQSDTKNDYTHSRIFQEMPL